MAEPNIEQLFQLALSHQAAGRFADAEKACRSILQSQPRNADAIQLLGLIAFQSGRIQEAIVHLLDATLQNPKAPDAFYNLGLALSASGQDEGAAEMFGRAVGLDPTFGEAQNNLGITLRKMGKLTEAVGACEWAVRLNIPEARGNLANAWVTAGDARRGIVEYRKALLEHASPTVHSNLLLAMHYLGDSDPGEIFAEHREWDRRWAGPTKSVAPRQINSPDPERPLRIGYVSPDVRGHSVAFFLFNLLSNHDPDRAEAHVYADLPEEDRTTQDLRQTVRHWRSIHRRSDEQVAQMIRDDRIDILVDLAGHTERNRLLVFAQKPVPIQVTYLGYPDTTGLAAMDYRLTDALADPPGDGDAFYSEKLIRLPGCFLSYRFADTVPRVSEPPGLKNGFATFGSFNALAKLTEPMIEIWSRILTKAAGSRIVVKSSGLEDLGVRERIVQQFAAGGVDRGRVELHGRIPTHYGHLGFYHEVDVALDTFPYHGTTTTCEAMCMGVPVVTLAGRTHVSRVGVSLLNCVGLREFIAESAEQYEKIALDAAADLARIASLRSTLRERMMQSPLLDGRSFAGNIESAYREMWRKWCGS